MEDRALIKKRIIIFIIIAFTLSWLLALVIYLTGGIENSREVTPGTGLTFFGILAIGYMFMPAIANFATRMITKEGMAEAYLAPKLRHGWKFWVAAWLLIPLFIILGMFVYFAIFPDQYDATMASFFEATGLAGMLPEGFSPLMYAASQVIAALLLSPILNGIPTFGEEFGWRAYLQPKLLKLMSPRAAVILTGVIWGVWHAPLIFMGYNYGTEHFGAPFMGPLMMVYFCVIVGLLIGWATIRAGSVWPAVIGHAVLNGTAALPAVFLVGDGYPLFGPYATGLIGGIFFAIAAVIILLVPKALTPPASEAPLPAEIDSPLTV